MIEFNHVTNPRDVRQLQIALYEASRVAHELMACAIEQKQPAPDVMSAFGRLQTSGTDAVLASK